MWDEARHWKLYAKAWDILDGRRNGHALAILELLCARDFAPAMNHLADRLAPRPALAIYRRAAALGDQTAAYNLAIEHRHRGDMTGYRHWLARAARSDPDARDELKAFRTRFPHTIMKRYRRFAPERD
jgi:hypothetical protein